MLHQSKSPESQTMQQQLYSYMMFSVYARVHTINHAPHTRNKPYCSTLQVSTHIVFVPYIIEISPTQARGYRESGGGSRTQATRKNSHMPLSQFSKSWTTRRPFRFPFFTPEGSLAHLGVARRGRDSPCINDAYILVWSSKFAQFLYCAGTLK